MKEPETEHHTYQPLSPTKKQGLITVGDLSTMLLYSVYAGFSISALLSYYGDLMKVGVQVYWVWLVVTMSGIFVGRGASVGWIRSAGGDVC